MFRSELLRIAAFRNLWLGQAISQVGDAFYYASFFFMVDKITGSKEMVGFVGAVETLPFLLFSPYAGVLADRMDRRKIMLLSDIISGLALCLLCAVTVFNSVPPVWLLFVTAFALSTVRSFFMPAKSAAIPAIVPPDMVMKATAFSMTTQNIMPLIGLAFAASIMGVLYAFSATWFFFMTCSVNAFSFFFSAWFVAKLPKILPHRADVHDMHPLADLVAGLRYIRSRHVLVALLLLSLFMNLFISPFFVVFVAANSEWFGGLPSTLAWSEFSFFFGMVLGSALVGRLNITRAGLGYVWGLAVVGAGVAAMAYSREFLLFAAFNVVCGIALPFAQIPLSTFMQLTVPDAFRGRVNSALTMISFGVAPIGMGLGGILIGKVGLMNAFLFMGIGMGAVALIGLLDPPFRNARIEMPAPPRAGSETPIQPLEQLTHAADPDRS